MGAVSLPKETRLPNITEQRDADSAPELALDDVMGTLELPSFSIRNYAFTVRSKDFVKCWPFPRRYLDSCLRKGREPRLPPFDPPGYKHNGFQRETQQETTVETSRWSQNAMGVSKLQGIREKHIEGIHKKKAVDAVQTLGTEGVMQGFAKECFKEIELCVEDKQEDVKQDQQLNNVLEMLKGTQIATLNNYHEDTINNDPKSGDRNVETVGGVDDNNESHLINADDEAEVVKIQMHADEVLEHGRLEMASTEYLKESVKCCVENPCSKNEGTVKTTEKLEMVHHLIDTKHESMPCNLDKVQNSIGDQMWNAQFQQPLGENNLPLETEKLGQESSIGVELRKKGIGSKSNEANSIAKLHDSTTVICSDGNTLKETNRSETGKRSDEAGVMALSSDVMVPQVCPVCRKFISASNTALNAHIDHCLAAVPPAEGSQCKVQKHRIKARKKRSMADIFAVAPTRTLEDLEWIRAEQWASNEAVGSENNGDSLGWTAGEIRRQPRTPLYRVPAVSWKGNAWLEKKEKREDILHVPNLEQEQGNRKRQPIGEENDLQALSVKNRCQHLDIDFKQHKLGSPLCTNADTSDKSVVKIHKSNVVHGGGNLSASNKSAVVTSWACTREPGAGAPEKQTSRPEKQTSKSTKLRVAAVSELKVHTRGSHEQPGKVGSQVLNGSSYSTCANVASNRCLSSTPDTATSSAKSGLPAVKKRNSSHLVLSKESILQSCTSLDAVEDLLSFKKKKRKKRKKSKRHNCSSDTISSSARTVDASFQDMELPSSNFAERLEWQGIRPVDTSVDAANKMMWGLGYSLEGPEQSILQMSESEACLIGCKEMARESSSVVNCKSVAATNRDHQMKVSLPGSRYRYLTCKGLKNIHKEVSIDNEKSQLDASTGPFGMVKQFQVCKSSKTKKIMNIPSNLKHREGDAKIQAAAGDYERKRKKLREEWQGELGDLSSYLKVATGMIRNGHEAKTLKCEVVPVIKGVAITDVHKKIVHPHLECSTHQFHPLVGCPTIQSLSPDGSPIVSNMGIAKHRFHSVAQAELHSSDAVYQGKEAARSNHLRKEDGGKIGNNKKILKVPLSVELGVSKTWSHKMTQGENILGHNPVTWNKISDASIGTRQVNKTSQTDQTPNTWTVDTFKVSTTTPDSIRKASNLAQHNRTCFISVTDALKERVLSSSSHKLVVSGASVPSFSSISTTLHGNSTVGSTSICVSAPPISCVALHGEQGVRMNLMATGPDRDKGLQSNDNSNNLKPYKSCLSAVQATALVKSTESVEDADAFGLNSDVVGTVLCSIDKSGQNTFEQPNSVSDSTLGKGQQGLEKIIEDGTAKSIPIVAGTASTLNANKPVQNFKNRSALVPSYYCSESLVESITSKEILHGKASPIVEADCISQVLSMDSVYQKETPDGGSDKSSCTGSDDCPMIQRVGCLSGIILLDTDTSIKEEQIKSKESQQQSILPSNAKGSELSLQGIPNNSSDRELGSISTQQHLLRSLIHTSSGNDTISNAGCVNHLPGNPTGTGWVHTVSSIQSTVSVLPHTSVAGKQDRSNLGLSSRLDHFGNAGYNGEPGVVHIFGNPVFKLMGKNVMVSNKDEKSLGQMDSHMLKNGRGCFPSISYIRHANCRETVSNVEMTQDIHGCLPQGALESSLLLNQELLPSLHVERRQEGNATFSYLPTAQDVNKDGPNITSHMACSTFGRMENAGTIGFLECRTETHPTFWDVSADINGLYTSGQVSTRLVHSANQPCPEAVRKSSSFPNGCDCTHLAVCRNGLLTQQLGARSLPSKPHLPTEQAAPCQGPALTKKSDCLFSEDLFADHRKMGLAERGGLHCQNCHTGTLSDIVKCAEGSQDRFWNVASDSILQRTQVNHT